MSPFELGKSLVDLLSGVLSAIAVFSLKHTDETVILAVDAIEIIVGEFAPPRFDGSTQLIPATYQDVKHLLYPS